MHIYCAVSQFSRHQTRILNHLRSRTKRTKRTERSKRSKPGTQCHTSATSLRKQTSKLRVSDPRYGAANKDVSCRHCAKDGAFGGHPAPPLGAYTASLLCVVSTESCVTQVPLCVVSTERCVIQVPYLPNFATLNVDTIKNAKNTILTG